METTTYVVKLKNKTVNLKKKISLGKQIYTRVTLNLDKLNSNEDSAL